MSLTVLQTDFPTLNLVNRGKVRDIYDLGEHLLLVTSDRLSAFDVIMAEGIPNKGKVLNQISIFWFRQMEDIVANHIVATDVNDFPAETHPYRAQLEGRSMLVKKARPLPVECIVRGYVAGSGWKEYRQSGTICGIGLPAGLAESAKLDQPIFTPSTKAELGEHDENIPFSEAVRLCGQEVAEQVRDISIAIYNRARDFARDKGILIADTKFEFGVQEDGSLLWIDEALSPDSSRFWPLDHYQPGGPQPSFDKQFVRDYLETLDWNKQAPPPPLPSEIVAKTSEKYQEALRLLTGITL
ncbi:MAG: phosphoribosylaminoimidazolesuccinocarboxamide synthase [Desulfuromonas sp.]|nr:MAG: phosphoribosylaminoimidazolesuccinocarboxamide synthase [Desulfuromonas sp.]